MSERDVVIIGGGISGLSALHFLKKSDPNIDAHLYEADNRLGGTIGTDFINGYSFDWGPNGFLDREPLTLRLCDELGLSDSLERANANVTKRFILRKGKLRAVPMSPPKFLLSDILSLKGKLRVMLEPFAKSRPENVDESIYDFAARRIGRDAADYLVQPMVSGVYGGIASKLSLKSTFKIMHEMESQYGSLFKAMIAKAKAAKKRKKKEETNQRSEGGGPSGPAGWLTSFYSGLYPIIDKFKERYDTSISTGIGIEKIIKQDKGYELVLTDGNTVRAKNVVVAVPSNKAAELFSEFGSELKSAFGKIAYAPIAVVCSGFKTSDLKLPLDGFGFLVPLKEKRGILGSIWTSSIFKDRAPKGSAQFRTMIGGDGDHASFELPENELTNIALKDLDRIIGINGDPELVKVYKWKHGIPQYHIGHSERMATIEKLLSESPGIYISGNAYFGISLNDCVKQSYKVSQEIINRQK